MGKKILDTKLTFASIQNGAPVSVMAQRVGELLVHPRLASSDFGVDSEGFAYLAGGNEFSVATSRGFLIGNFRNFTTACATARQVQAMQPAPAWHAETMDSVFPTEAARRQAYDLVRAERR